MGEELGRADQRLGGHAAGVEAVAAELVAFDQRHPGFHRRGDVRGHQAGRSAADDDEVAVEAGGLLIRPFRVHLARLHRRHDALGDQREDAQQYEGAEQGRREDAGERIDLAKLGAGIHIHDGAGEHAELADPVEGADADRGQTHQQIDDEEGEGRHQAQREQVEAAFLLDAGVDRLEAVAEALLHPVAQQKARGQKGQRGADAGGEGDDHQPGQQPENRAGDERQHRRAGKGQGRHRDIDGKEHARGRPRVSRAVGLDGRMLTLEVVEAEKAPQIKQEIAHHEGGNQNEESEFFLVHGRAALRGGMEGGVRAALPTLCRL